MILSGFNELVRIVNEYDTIIYDNTREHYKTDHGDDTDWMIGDPKSEESSGECKWYGKHDNEW